MIGEGLFAKLKSRPARCRMVVACLFVMALSACSAPLFDARPDLVRTWEEAWVYLPAAEDGDQPVAAKIGSLGGKAAARIARFQERGPKPPVVLYLHGCTGLGNIVFFDALAQAGYVVIAPDSMARGFRPLQCDPETRTGGHNLFVYDFRLAEISYALERMRELSWIDHDNQFLAGTSEGGVAVALYRGGEFRARVIAQWTCRGDPIVQGLAAPASTPVLAIVHADDPWYGPERTVDQQGHCGEFMAERLTSRTIVLESGDAHNIFADPDNVTTIVNFLTQHADH